MIARHWRGVTRADQADAYVEHLHTETFPKLETIPGFAGVTLLRRAIPLGVEFLVITRWRSLDDIRRFAGEDAEVAVVPDVARAMMVEYDDVARHYEIVE